MFNGAKIKKLREEKGLTQSNLGNQIGADGNLISRWERQKAIPSSHYMQKLSEVFDKPMEFFLTDTNQDIKERSITENKGVLVFEFDSQRLEVPATAEFSAQFWERVDRMIELGISKNSTV